MSGARRGRPRWASGPISYALFPDSTPTYIEEACRRAGLRARWDPVRCAWVVEREEGAPIVLNLSSGIVG